MRKQNKTNEPSAKMGAKSILQGLFFIVVRSLHIQMSLSRKNSLTPFQMKYMDYKCVHIDAIKANKTTSTIIVFIEEEY